MPKLTLRETRKERARLEGFSPNWFIKFDGWRKWRKIAQIAFGNAYVQNWTLTSGPHKGYARDENETFLPWKVFLERSLDMKTLKQVTSKYWKNARKIERKKIKKQENRRIAWQARRKNCEPPEELPELQQTLSKLSFLHL